eukprot:7416946-Alexandrium_andersonii.AAC.1
MVRGTSHYTALHMSVFVCAPTLFCAEHDSKRRPIERCGQARGLCATDAPTPCRPDACVEVPSA